MILDREYLWLTMIDNVHTLNMSTCWWFSFFWSSNAKETASNIRISFCAQIRLISEKHYIQVASLPMWNSANNSSQSTIQQPATELNSAYVFFQSPSAISPFRLYDRSKMSLETIFPNNFKIVPFNPRMSKDHLSRTVSSNF